MPSSRVSQPNTRHRRCRRTRRGDEGVLIDHVGEEEPPDARVPSRVLDGGPDLLEPLITASRRERPVRGMSGVKRKSGRTKTRNQAAESGPVIRRPRGAAGSSPKSGSRPR